ncbi:hypothetical protein ACH5RR_038691 [Cinchona calisaya]|uniref:Uncharacterized protein n=1 Tax=Cinchona calisaya TaxID=153742 RepID=A0ABD2XXC6_9GENT
MKRKRRKISLSDIYTKTVPLVPDLISSDRSAAHGSGSSLSPALPSPSSSAAPAGTGTEVATREQLDLPMELDLPTLFRQGDFPVPPLPEEIQEVPIDPIDAIFYDLCDQMIEIVPPLFPFRDLYSWDQRISLSLFAMLEESFFPLECLQGIYFDLITNGTSSSFLHFFLDTYLL